jgi:hypothetical protein
MWTGSITLSCKKGEAGIGHKCALKTRNLLISFALLVFLSGVARADFVVKDVDARLGEQDLRVSTRIELNLSEQAEMAIENGVPLVLLTEFQLQGRGVLWKRTLLESRVRQQLRYHSLADRYVVEDLGTGEIDLFNSVNEALNSMGVLREQVFALPKDVKPGVQEYTLAVRSRLDINRLPAALRPLAFFSPSWRLSSDWTRWQVKIQ